MQDASRIELQPISQRLDVDGKLLAESTRALELRERGYPPRYYFPREDMLLDLLALFETTTNCPFKGSTVYFSLGEI